MKPIAKLILLGAVSALVFPLTQARGQAGQKILDKTTFGSSQNDSRDMVNSLVPGPRSYGKGEKKEEISAAQLKSKANKDTTFGGSLMNIGINGAEPKLDEQQKRHSAPSEEAQPSKESQAVTAKDSKPSALDERQQQSSFSNLSVTATLADSLSQEDAKAKSESKGATASSSTSEAADKRQRSTSSAATDEKPSATSTEKSSAAKPDGGEH
jgi:hypothetical protein